MSESICEIHSIKQVIIGYLSFSILFNMIDLHLEIFTQKVVLDWEAV